MVPDPVAAELGGRRHNHQRAGPSGGSSSYLGKALVWSGKHIQFHSDNMAVVAILKKRTAKTPMLMHLLRRFSLYCAHFGTHFSAEHIPGVANTAADALSRDNLPLPYPTDRGAHGHPSTSPPRHADNNQTGNRQPGHSCLHDH